MLQSLKGSGQTYGSSVGLTIRFLPVATQYLPLRSCSNDPGFAQGIWAWMRSKVVGDPKDASPRQSSPDPRSGGSSDSRSLVSYDHESRYREVHVVELLHRPMLPGGILPVIVENSNLVTEIQDIKKKGAQAYVGAFLTRQEPQQTFDQVHSSGSAEVEQVATGVESLDQLMSVGTFAQVHRIMEAPSVSGDHSSKKRWQLLISGHRRIRADKLIESNPLKVSVQHLKDMPYHKDDDVLKATSMEVVSTIKELVTYPLYAEQLRNLMAFGGDLSDASRLADVGAMLSSAQREQMQEVLEELDVPKRLSRVLHILKSEVQLTRLQADIGRKVEEKISKDQRRYLLMEQLKSIKQELGLEKDEKQALIQKFREKFEPYEKAAPEEVKRVVEEEIEKLQSLEPAAVEFNVTRNYLEWLTGIPWGYTSKEILDIERARTILDEDHYGLQDVKERILEFIAVGKLRGFTQGKILCLVGPPGVGKTSVGKSIARALDRKYYRFSVGGLSDVAEIKGHRRTYVGAMPGKLVQCLKSTATCNPLVLIDEIDKLGRGWSGDPASALLETLDPEQNKTFMDHYMDVPIDLSKVLFMCTANVLDTIPAPLLDRMEVIRISGYISDEKFHIAKNYLEPQARELTGVPVEGCTITEPALRLLIEEYCREAGVRNLKKQIEKIYRKVALKLVQKGARLSTDNEENGEETTSQLSDTSKQTSNEVNSENTVAALNGQSFAF